MFVVFVSVHSGGRRIHLVGFIQARQESRRVHSGRWVHLGVPAGRRVHSGSLGSLKGGRFGYHRVHFGSFASALVVVGVIGVRWFR